MNDAVQAAIAALEKVVQTVAPFAQSLFAEALRLNYLYAVVDLVSAGVLLVLAGCGVYRIWGLQPKYDTETCALLMVFPALGLAMAFHLALAGVARLYAPELHTLQDLAHMLGQ